MTESDLLARMDALRADAAKCNSAVYTRKIAAPQYGAATKRMLEILWTMQEGAQRISDIAKANNSQMNTIGVLLDGMMKRGLVERVSRGTYAITDKGREAIAEESNND